MNQRERTLAIVVGVLMLCAVLYYGGKKAYDVIAARNEQLTKLEEELDLKREQSARGTIAGRLLTTYESCTLPEQRAVASSHYTAWLRNWVESAGIYGGDVKYARRFTTVIVDKEPVHEVLEFTVMCDGTLPQLVQMLYAFYSQDYLHRIKNLSIVPRQDQILRLTFTIEAISMPGASDEQLEDRPAHRLALDSLEDYNQTIVYRNPYAPANKPPQFTSSRSQRGYVGQRMSFTPEVKDPESGRITYRVDTNGLEGLRVDPRSGRIDWTPSEVGEYELLVYATDDGIPAKEAMQKIYLAVSEPPPPEPVGPPPEQPRRFDEAKYTFVTGIVEVNGRKQVWLTVRTEGKWLRLYEGDEFTVGALEGKVIRIHTRNVEIEDGGRVYSVRFGQSLYDGEELRSVQDVAARDQ